MSALEDFKSFLECAMDDSMSRNTAIEFACKAIREAVEAEREACSKVAGGMYQRGDIGRDIANAIRTREDR